MIVVWIRYEFIGYTLFIAQLVPPMREKVSGKYYVFNISSILSYTERHRGHTELHREISRFTTTSDYFEYQ